MLSELVRLTRRHAVPISRVCDKLGISEKELGGIVRAARADGYVVTMTDGVVSSRVAVGPTADDVRLGSTRPGRYHVAHVTDLHFGSRHRDQKGLERFLHTAWRRGCRVGVMTGDALDGNKDVLLPDQDRIGWDHQAEDAVETFRKGPPIKWAAIDGNHDGYFSASMGTVSGKHLETAMRAAGVAWTFLGVCLGRARIHGARWQLWHPHGGASTRNAVRRVLNERIESLQEPCDVLAIGHYHKHTTVPAYPERVFGVSGGTFQTKLSEFANRITRPWDIGGTIVSYTLGRDGRVREVSAEFIETGT